LYRLAKPGYATPEDWAVAVGDVAGVAVRLPEWLTEKEQRWIRNTAVGSMEELLTEAWPSQHVPDELLRSCLVEYLAWLGGQSQSTILSFCWKLLTDDYRRRHCDQSRPVLWLRDAGHLQGDLEYLHLDLAVTLAGEADQMFWWGEQRTQFADWQKASAPFYLAIGHESYVVRRWGAVALGTLHAALDETGRAGMPTQELLEWIGNLESRSPGISGAFLQGTGLMDEPDRVDDRFLRPWMLDVLRRGGPEPMVPGVQSLEFYAHEFFCGDPDAIRQMLAMGRRYLAVITATEEPGNIGRLREVLEEMAASDDREVALAIREYLGSMTTHAGIGHLREEG